MEKFFNYLAWILIGCLIGFVVSGICSSQCYGQESVEGPIRDRWQAKFEAKQNETVAEMKGIRDVVQQLREANEKQAREAQEMNRGLFQRLAGNVEDFKKQIAETRADRIAAREDQTRFLDRLKDWTPGQNVVDRISGLVQSVTWLLAGVGVMLLVAFVVMLFAAYLFLRLRKIAGV